MKSMIKRLVRSDALGYGLAWVLFSLSNEALGDKVNLFNGTVRFSHDLIALPGNSALPVKLGVFYDPHDIAQGQLHSPWDLDLPYVDAIHHSKSAENDGWVATPDNLNNGHVSFERSMLLRWASALVLSAVAFAAQAQTVEYIHTDALGTPVAVTDANQNVVERSEYEPYGRLINRAAADEPGYTGHVSDSTTGLSYMQQRYYDPEIGRFLNVDPVTAYKVPGKNFNRFWYANNNPYRFTDPDGRWVCEGKNCLAFEKALKRVSAAAVSPRLNPNERVAIQRVVNFYGAKGDNKVSISFKSLGGPGGNAALRADGGSHITLDMSNAERTTEDRTLDVLARATTHEGEHGANDQARGRAVNSRAERKTEEISGYTTQAYYQKAAGFSESSADGWTFWGGIMHGNIERQAEGSINASCGTSREGSCK